MNLFLKDDIKRIVDIKIDEIMPSPNQARKIFNNKDLKSLAHSIDKNGILQPLSLRVNSKGAFELVAGERRLRAAKLIGLKTVPCIIKNMDYTQSAVMTLVENIQRENLNFYEEAVGIETLMRVSGLNQSQAAERLGKSQPSVANKLRLLKLPKQVINTLIGAGLTERHGRAILKLKNDEQQIDMAKLIAEKALNVKQTEDLIERQICFSSRTLGKKKHVIKDLRIFLNTLTNAVATLNAQGINVKSEREEDKEHITIKIVIPKGHRIS